jgi:hypothetical protein
MGICSQTAGSTCEYRVNPVNFTFIELGTAGRCADARQAIKMPCGLMAAANSTLKPSWPAAGEHPDEFRKLCVARGCCFTTRSCFFRGGCASILDPVCRMTMLGGTMVQ